MATVKSKKKVTTLEKPISYTKVETPAEEESLSSALKEAGERANTLVKNTSYKLGSEEDSPEFMPVKPEVEKEEDIVEPEAEVRDVNNFEDLFGAFNDIDKKFESISDKDYYPEDSLKNAIPDSLDLNTYEVPEINKDELRAEVTESESNKAEVEKNNLKQEAAIKTDAKLKEIESLKKESENEKAEIKQIYDEYKINVESDAIKRGLARSSVAVLSIENIEGARATELSRVAENLSKAITDVESEIGILQQNLDISLNNLDLELAEKINTELSKKIEELEEKQKEAIEFNNNVSKLQAEYKAKVADNENTSSKIEEKLAQEYAGAADADKKSQKLDLALNYFKTMNKTDALRVIIGSPELAQALGDDYYALYYYIMRQ